MIKTKNIASLSLIFALITTGCSSIKVIQSEPSLDMGDCGLKRETVIVESGWFSSKVIDRTPKTIGFDIGCGDHKKDLVDKQTSHDQQMAKLAIAQKEKAIRLSSAAELLTIRFQSTANEAKKTEYLQRILANLSSNDKAWRIAQEGALSAKGITQNDIIRAEVIDLIHKTKDNDILVQYAAASELLRIHRREKYPSRYNIPRQIVEIELEEQNLNMNYIQQKLQQANTKQLSTCKLVKNTNKKVTTFVCN